MLPATVLCYVMLCYAMLCYVMLCYAMLCYAMLRYATLRYVTLRYVTLKLEYFFNPFPGTTEIEGRSNSENSSSLYLCRHTMRYYFNYFVNLC